MKKTPTLILDCDGVILDSNLLKVEVVRKVLLEMPQMFPNNKVEAAVESFKCNFGKSRYWHVENMQNYLNKPCMNFKDKFLSDYVNALKKSYSRASLCDGIEVFLKNNKLQKYIVSGSDQDELRKVLKSKNLDKYFVKIFGSPTSKSDNISSIKKIVNGELIFFGDSFEDLKASEQNQIEFIFYKPYSLVKSNLEEVSRQKGYRVLESWRSFSFDG